MGFNKFRVARESSGLYTRDITRKRHRSYTPRNSSLDVSDIEGARPRRLYPDMNKSCVYLSNEDIEGSKVKPMHMKPNLPDKDRTQTKYTEFCYNEKELVVPKFLRDTLRTEVVDS